MPRLPEDVAEAVEEQASVHAMLFPATPAPPGEPGWTGESPRFPRVPGCFLTPSGPCAACGWTTTWVEDGSRRRWCGRCQRWRLPVVRDRGGRKRRR